MNPLAFELCRDLQEISVKKQKKLRVLFFGRDAFSDNSKYLYLYMLEHYPDLDIQWCSANPSLIHLLQAEGLPCFDLSADLHNSLDFLLESAIALFCVNPLESVGHNLLMLSALRGAATFQMWHGIGPKQADLALTAVKNITDLSATKLMLGAAFPEYFISSSEFIDSKWNAFFGARKFIRASFPRNELLLREATEKEMLGAVLDERNYTALYHDTNKKILLAPTWEAESGLNNIALISGIVSWCQKHNIHVFIKKHPFINESNDAARNIKNLFTIPSSVDIYPHLKHFDALITDYSSIIYDFILTEKPVATTDISHGADFDFGLIPGDDSYRYKINEMNVGMIMEEMLNHDSKKHSRAVLASVLFQTNNVNANKDIAEKVLATYASKAASKRIDII